MAKKKVRKTTKKKVKINENIGIEKLLIMIGNLEIMARDKSDTWYEVGTCASNLYTALHNVSEIEEEIDNG